MDFGDPTKFSHAKRIAAALGYIGLTGLDRIAIHAFSDRVRPIVPPTYGKIQFSKMSKALEAVEVGGKTGVAACLKYLITHSRQAGAAVIISDFLDMNGYQSGLKQLLARKFDLTLIQILADAEINPQLLANGGWKTRRPGTLKKSRLTKVHTFNTDIDSTHSVIACDNFV